MYHLGTKKIMFHADTHILSQTGYYCNINCFGCDWLIETTTLNVIGLLMNYPITNCPLTNVIGTDRYLAEFYCYV